MGRITVPVSSNISIGDFSIVEILNRGPEASKRQMFSPKKGNSVFMRLADAFHYGIGPNLGNLQSHIFKKRFYKLLIYYLC